MPSTDIKSFDHFEQLLLNNGAVKHDKKYIIVDFYIDICKPCKEFAPTFEEFSDQYGANILFVKVNAAKIQDIALEYRVSTYPTFMFFQVGNITQLNGTIIGKPMAEEGIKNMIKSWTIEPTIIKPVIVEDF